MKRPLQLIELCAGTAAVSFAALGAPRFPVTRVGSKAGYADAILDLMNIRPGSLKSAILVEADPGMAKALDALTHIPKTVANMFAERRSAGTERQVWAKAKGCDDTASFLIRMAGSRGGIGGFRGVHKLRPQASPIPVSIERRIRAFLPFAKRNLRVEVVCKDVGELLPTSVMSILWGGRGVVYIDPPYVGRMGFGAVLGLPVEELAKRWAWYGFPVYVSEARPLPGANRCFEITHQRRGQSRRSLTTSNQEFISYWEPRQL